MKKEIPPRPLCQLSATRRGIAKNDGRRVSLTAGLGQSSLYGPSVFCSNSIMLLDNPNPNPIDCDSFAPSLTCDVPIAGHQENGTYRQTSNGTIEYADHWNSKCLKIATRRCVIAIPTKPQIWRFIGRPFFRPVTLCSIRFASPNLAGSWIHFLNAFDRVASSKLAIREREIRVSGACRRRKPVRTVARTIPCKDEEENLLRLLPSLHTNQRRMP